MAYPTVAYATFSIALRVNAPYSPLPSGFLEIYLEVLIYSFHRLITAFLQNTVSIIKTFKVSQQIALPLLLMWDIILSDVITLLYFFDINYKK